MISLELAEQLRDAGLTWLPRIGDQFTIPRPEMSGEVFTISDMMIEAHEFSTGTVLGFNGTTEWALDSVAQDDALWLPREDQLREALGDRLARLERGADGWSVVLADGRRFHDPDVESAYALALLATA